MIQSNIVFHALFDTNLTLQIDPENRQPNFLRLSNIEIDATIFTKQYECLLPNLYIQNQKKERKKEIKKKKKERVIFNI